MRCQPRCDVTYIRTIVVIGIGYYYNRLVSTCGNSTACCLLNQEACCSPLLYLASLLPPLQTHHWRKLAQHAQTLNTLIINMKEVTN